MLLTQALCGEREKENEVSVLKELQVYQRPSHPSSYEPGQVERTALKEVLQHGGRGTAGKKKIVGDSPGALCCSQSTVHMWYFIYYLHLSFQASFWFFFNEETDSERLMAPHGWAGGCQSLYFPQGPTKAVLRPLLYIHSVVPRRHLLRRIWKQKAGMSWGGRSINDGIIKAGFHCNEFVTSQLLVSHKLCFLIHKKGTTIVTISRRSCEEERSYYLVKHVIHWLVIGLPTNGFST